jgi:nucleoside-diphosphate-sugar epimerase
MGVLVLGGTGFIGGPLVARLLANSVETAVAHRGARHVAVGARSVVLDRGDPAAVLAAVAHRGARHVAVGARSVVLDRGDPAAVLAAVGETGATTVVDLLAYTQADTLPLLDALSGRIERYVMASSIDVYANYEGLHRKGRPTPVWDRLTEEAALRTSRHPYRLTRPRSSGDPQAWMDDYDKIPLEEAARARLGEAATILRLPMVFGPGDRQRRFSWAIRPMVEGRARFNIPQPWAAWRATFGYVDDVAAGIALAAVHPRAGGETFNLGRDLRRTSGLARRRRTGAPRRGARRPGQGRGGAGPGLFAVHRQRQNPAAAGLCGGHRPRRGAGPDGGRRDGALVAEI